VTTTEWSSGPNGELKVDTQNQTTQQSPEVQKISGGSAKVLLQLESAQAIIISRHEDFGETLCEKKTMGK
jgi:hypothetical protein